MYNKIIANMVYISRNKKEHDQINYLNIYILRLYNYIIYYNIIFYKTLQINSMRTFYPILRGYYIKYDTTEMHDDVKLDPYYDVYFNRALNMF